jgi:hypothetical protein
VYMLYPSSFLSNRLTEMTSLYDRSIYPKFFSLGTYAAIATGQKLPQPLNVPGVLSPPWWHSKGFSDCYTV